MAPASINWAELRLLANQLDQPGLGPGSVSQEELHAVERALDQLLLGGDSQGIVRLREMFTGALARDTATGYGVMQRLSAQAIVAAREIGDKVELAHLLGAEGHNLHRQGYHTAAIQAFEESSRLYQEVGKPFEALKSYFMTSLCHRALGDRPRARQILNSVLREVEPDNPWRGQPIQVVAWLAQDDGRLSEAEALLREAISLHEKGKDSDILIAGNLADLAEVVGLQGRPVEADELFRRSLTMLRKYEGQYDRQEARTSLKLAELLARQRRYDEALHLLEKADVKVSRYGHYYDLLWRIELTRAFIYFRQKRCSSAIRKLRATLRIRRALKLSNVMLARQIVGRLVVGAGLPR